MTFTDDRILLRDMEGRLLQQHNLHGAQGQVVLDTRQLATGVYSVELMHDGSRVSSARVTVQP